MMIRSVALLAISAVWCLNAANAVKAPLAVYYSFDLPPTAALLSDIQAELGRILAPSGLRATWRATDAPKESGEEFPGIVVFRFEGRCYFDSSAEPVEPFPGGQPLAETQLVDGRILPFGNVNCDKVRQFIAPAVKSKQIEDRNAALGRALARVSAHEIYHMLTGSETHANRGIARASHSRVELTAATFSFAKPENDWLRLWVTKQSQAETALQTADNHSNAEPPSGVFGEREPASFAGR